jgi:hypothetical protein
MEYIPLIVILLGLGAMAYFLTKSGKDTDNKRAELSTERGWDYTPFNSTLVLTIPEAERNISYRLAGVAADGTAWHMTSRYQKSIETSARTRLILNPSAEWLAEKSFKGHFLVMLHQGITLPDFIMTEIFKKLEFPVDVPRLEDSILPAELSKRYAVYCDNSEDLDFIAASTPHLDSWTRKYPGNEKALIYTGSPTGFKMRTEFDMEKESDMEFFVNTGLSIIG